MVGRVENKALSLLKGAALPSGSPPSGDASEFNLLLQERLAPEKGLEGVVLEYLLRMLESVLSSNTSAGAESSFPTLPSLGLPASPPSPSPPEKAEHDPVPEEGPPIQQMPEASINLQQSRDLDSLVEQASRKHGVEPALIRAVIRVESNGNPAAVSPVGAQGLMQLMPRTAQELGVSDPFDPAQNIMAGARYLRQLLDRYKGNKRLALAAYNWGMGNLEKRPGSLPKETQDFVVRVESHYRRFAGSSQSV